MKIFYALALMASISSSLLLNYNYSSLELDPTLDDCFDTATETMNGALDAGYSELETMELMNISLALCMGWDVPE